MSMSKYAEILKDYVMKEGYNLNFEDIGDYTILELSDYILPGVKGNFTVFFPKETVIITLLTKDYISEINPLKREVVLELANSFNMKYSCAKCILRNNTLILEEEILLIGQEFNPEALFNRILDFFDIMKDEYPYFRDLALY